jgi:hypothetical protein
LMGLIEFIKWFFWLRFAVLMVVNGD